MLNVTMVPAPVVQNLASRRSCIYDILAAVAAQAPDATAVLAPGYTPFTYGRLSRQLHEVNQQLRAMGIMRNDRIALVLPNGPVLAAAFVAIGASAACAPLNPSLRASEFDRYLSGLEPRALIIQSGTDSAAAAVAQARGIGIIHLIPELDADARIFRL